MASASMGADKIGEVTVDASTLNHLMYSIGRLKFTLRSLETMNLQVAVLPPEETDQTFDCPHSLESNTILEKAISETLTQRSDKVDNKQSKTALSLEELELVQAKLSNELQKVRLKYKDAFTKDSTKSISIS